jgi:HPt (histidine-containing phosphotransfer) domain-containing protein
MKSNIIDYAFLNEQYEGDQEYLNYIFSVYLKNFDSYIEELRALESLEKTKESIHKIKSSLSLVGLGKLKIELEQLEKKDIWTEIDYKNLDSLVDQIISAKEDVENELKFILKND